MYMRFQGKKPPNPIKKIWKKVAKLISKKLFNFDENLIMKTDYLNQNNNKKLLIKKLSNPESNEKKNTIL